MSREIKIIIIVVLALIIARVLLLMVGRNKSSDTIVLVLWATLLSTSALTHSLYAVLGMIVLIKLFYLRNDQEKNITTYFALWAVLPFHFYIPYFPTSSLPLFGGNYQRLLTLVWIVPLLPALLAQARQTHRRVLFDLPFFILMILTVKHQFSPQYEYPPTLITSIKNTIQISLDFIIPYYVIAVWANSWIRVKKLLWALLIAAMVLAILGIVEAVRHWNIFNDLRYVGMRDVSGFAQYRDFLRIKTTFPEPISYGLYGIGMAGIGIALLFRSKSAFPIKMFVVVMLLAALYATQSRGDWVGAMFLIVFFLFFRMRTFSKIFYITVLVITIPIVGLLQSDTFLTGTRIGLDDFDNTGTFEYRKELFFGMLEILPRNPWFGNSMYKAVPEMQALVQGQGIVDPVNTYMTIAVSQGLITLFFFLFITIRSINTGLRYVRYGFARDNPVWVHVGAALAALIAGMAIALTFTSFFATIVVYFWIVVGIARAMQLNLEKKLAIREERASDEWR